MINKTQEEIMVDWIGDINDPLVSVKCTTYNHNQYIANALDSFLMQKTTFPFEIIVHDDASTDNTAKIIHEYEKKYPLIIKPIYEKENQYSKHDGSLNRIINKKIKGKYIAFCEGDDYWIDNQKIQKQYDFMENHKECVLCVHNTKIIDANSNKTLRLFNDFDKSKYLKPEDVFFGWKVHTSSYFIDKKFYFNFPVLKNQSKYWFGDYMILCWSLYFGQIYCMFDVMSVYNKNIKTGSLRMNMVYNENLADRIIARAMFLEEYNDITNNLFINFTSVRIEDIKLQYDSTKFDKNSIKNNTNAFNRLCSKDKIKVLIKVYLSFIYILFRKAKK